jgi:hypothetical protein
MIESILLAFAVPLLLSTSNLQIESNNCLFPPRTRTLFGFYKIVAGVLRREPAIDFQTAIAANHAILLLRNAQTRHLPTEGDRVRKVSLQENHLITRLRY